MLSLAQTIKDLKNNIVNILNTMAPKTYVDKKVADLVNGAPAQLDTLQELSKALNNDKDFGATVNNAIAKKLDSAGGTITGNLTVNGTLTAKASTAGTADRALKADTCTGNAATASSVAWSGVTNKPTTFTPSAHNHAWNNITGTPATATRWPSWNEVTDKPASLPPAAHNHDSLYPSTTGTRASGTWGINITGSAGGVAWANVSGKPTSFTPAAHGHAWNDITGKPSTFAPSSHSHGWGEISDKPAQATRWPTWGEVSEKPTSFTPATHSHSWDSITSKPSTFTPSGHSHGWGDITGAPATATRWPTWDEIAGKPATFPSSGGGVASSVAWANVTDKPSTFMPSSHSHGWDDITGAPATATRWPTWDEITGKPSSKNIIKNGTPTKDISLRYETENGKNVVVPYVDGVKVPFANNGFEEVDFDSRILTFEPILNYSDMPSWNGGVTDDGFVEATGEVRISYSEHAGTEVNYRGKHGTISLGKIPSNDIDKSATISGGYQSGTNTNVPEERNRLIEATQSYIREHLDDFKAKAFNAIPESSNAIEFKIIPPDDVPMGSFHGGSQGGGH